MLFQYQINDHDSPYMKLRVKDIQSFQVACDLMELGLRVSLVNKITRIDNKRLLYNLWDDIYDERPTPGRAPQNVLSYIKSYQTAAEISGFVSLYKSIEKDIEEKSESHEPETSPRDVNPYILLDAWKSLLELTPVSIDINAGYYAIRDIHANIVVYASCQSCSGSFIYDISKRYTEKCPFCKTMCVDY